jgi:hypothetical protein
MVPTIARLGPAALLAGLVSTLAAQPRVTSPTEQFGWPIGTDYQLTTYTQLTDYWKKLASESDRMKLVSIGKTAEGRDQWMAIISSPANLAKLDHYRSIASRLARADGLDDSSARALAKEGKAVVWIDGGLHAVEVLGAQQLIEHVYQMTSRTDEETMRILDDVIQLVVHANPDGMELVSNWYLRRTEPTRRSMAGLPRLYQKYIGHDNNRDFYLNAMPETKNMSRVLYREWYPAIVYNHHQTGPAGAVMFAPPFRDPHNYRLDPILINSLSVVGTAMHRRFAAEGKPGVVDREASSYQTWWNGGLRTTAYFHNMIGILTETIGSPTPIRIPLAPDRLVASSNDPYPILPQAWSFRQSIDYSITANRAILDHASRYREPLLYDLYLMARNAIRKGSEDQWTILPERVERLRRTAAAEGFKIATDPFGERTLDDRFADLLRRPEDRDPRGYVIPSDQPDFPTATRFVNALIESGVEARYATRPFEVRGKLYPTGSYVLSSAQAFRAHLLDLMEPQNYPNDIPYPGGAPKAPYDNAGYTLAMQMGVVYDRILDGFDCPCARIADVLSRPPVPAALPAASGYLLGRRVNDSYLAVNRLLARRQRVESAGEDFYVPASGEATRILRELVEQRGLPVRPAQSRPARTTALAPVRIGLWDEYGGSAPSGWLRWILEQFEFPFQLVYPPELDRGGLADRFDVLVFPTGAIPRVGAPPRAPAMVPEDAPAEWRERAGRVSAEKTVPELRRFLEGGGRIVTIGSSTSLAGHLDLPVENYLLERTPDGTVKPLPREKLFIPASLLEVEVDSTTRSAQGMGSRAIVMFDESPVFRLPPDASTRGVRPVAWFNSASPLRSGWAWGQTYLEGGVAAAEATVGKGTLFLFGPEVTFRAQPWGTFRLVFNAIWG